MPQSTDAPATSENVPRHVRSPILVAIAGWILPGLGYWLIGQRARALVTGITIIILFTAGTLIGGVRAIQVPGYGEDGGKLYAWYAAATDPDRPGTSRQVTVVSETRPLRGQFRQGPWVVTEFRSILSEIGNKPWSICQIMGGPMAIIGGAASVSASRPADASDLSSAPGKLSHSRINEIAVLYTAVAGMLNLLVLIDAAGRADDMLAMATGKHRGPLYALFGLTHRGAPPQKA
jgi:hypothetical protein